MITLIYKKGNDKQIIKKRNKVFYLNRELDLIDFFNTTAWCPFCKIRFKDTQEEFLEIVDRIRDVNKRGIF